MNASSIDIAGMLEEDSSLGLALATNLFVGKEPTKPNICVTIFDTAGLPPQLALKDQGLEYPSVQIRVRNTDYENGWNLISTIKDYLHGRAQVYVGSVLYTVIYCSSGPALLDWDDNNRVRFIANFNIVRR